jgi:hypothetical protein
MERVETLLKKLQEQFAQNAPAEQLLLTVQMLQAELLHLQAGNSGAFSNSNIAVTVSQNFFVNAPEKNRQDQNTPIAEEKIIEVLQVDEAELEAELEEIKRNAEMMKKISVQNKPPILFESDEEDIPTLSHQHQPKAEQHKKDINEIGTGGTTSVNEKLKQSKIDLGDSFTEIPIRDLKKAIGVNDRFLFINELFRGDEVTYERSIKTINSFTILPEAEYWIQRELKVKNGWNDDDELVKQFYQLVKRRFS